MTALSDLINLDASTGLASVETVLLVLVLAFCIGHLIGWVYMWTHTGLSYSQSFAASLLILPVITSLVMLLMAGSLVIAFGLFAVFAVVRFRNVLKDTRDTSFVLWAMIEGMAAGTQRFSTAILGLLFIYALYVYVRLTSFGGRHRYDVVLSLQCDGLPDQLADLRGILHRHSARAQLASQRDLDPTGIDLSYRLLLRDPSRARELLEDLRESLGVTRVAIYHREDESEV
jgi:hypothetical protein